MLPVCGRKSGRIILRLHFINERAKSIFLIQVEEDQAAAAVSISFKQHFPFFFLKEAEEVSGMWILLSIIRVKEKASINRVLNDETCNSTKKLRKTAKKY